MRSIFAQAALMFAIFSAVFALVVELNQPAYADNPTPPRPQNAKKCGGGTMSAPSGAIKFAAGQGVWLELHNTAYVPQGIRVTGNGSSNAADLPPYGSKTLYFSTFGYTPISYQLGWRKTNQVEAITYVYYSSVCA